MSSTTPTEGEFPVVEVISTEDTESLVISVVIPKQILIKLKAASESSGQPLDLVARSFVKWKLMQP